MPGPNFAALAIKATAATDAVMAEPWAFAPMKKPIDVNATIAADSSRQAATVNATFLDKVAPRELLTIGYNTPQRRPPGIETGTPRIWISPSEMANQAIALGAALVVRAEDLLVRQSDGVTWRVNSVEPTAGGALRCNVNIVG